MHTFDSSQVTGSENQVSSKITSGVRGFLLHMIAAIEDVTITLLYRLSWLSAFERQSQQTVI